MLNRKSTPIKSEEYKPQNKTYIVTCENHGLQQRVFINCNESRAMECIAMAAPTARWFQEASDSDMQAARLLHLPVYMY